MSKYHQPHNQIMDLGRRLLVFLFTAVFEKMRRKKGEQLLSPRSRAHRSEPRTIKILNFFSSRNSNWMEVSASPTSSAIVEVQDEPASSGSNCKVWGEWGFRFKSSKICLVLILPEKSSFTSVLTLENQEQGNATQRNGPGTKPYFGREDTTYYQKADDLRIRLEHKIKLNSFTIHLIFFNLLGALEESTPCEDFQSHPPFPTNTSSSSCSIIGPWLYQAHFQKLEPDFLKLMFTNRNLTSSSLFSKIGTWGPSDLGGKTRHALPLPSHPSSSKIFHL